jgi:hypothetical protein
LVLQAAIGMRASGAIDDAYDAWKQADAAARRLERELNDTWHRYERGVGAPPSKGLLRDTAWQRHAAGEKLDHVIGLLHAAGYIQPARGAARAAHA